MIESLHVCVHQQIDILRSALLPFHSQSKSHHILKKDFKVRSIIYLNSHPAFYCGSLALLTHPLIAVNVCQQPSSEYNNDFFEHWMHLISICCAKMSQRLLSSQHLQMLFPWILHCVIFQRVIFKVYWRKLYFQPDSDLSRNQTKWFWCQTRLQTHEPRKKAPYSSTYHCLKVIHGFLVHSCARPVWRKFHHLHQSHWVYGFPCSQTHAAQILSHMGFTDCRHPHF